MSEQKKNAPAAAKAAGGTAAKRKAVQSDTKPKNAATGQETAFTAVVFLYGRFSYLNLREHPSLNAPILATMSEGEKVTVMSCDADHVWANVRRSDGTTGWAMWNYVFPLRKEAENGFGN